MNVSLYTMSSVVGDLNTIKQRAVVEVVINRKNNIQTIEVKDFINNTRKHLNKMKYMPILNGLFENFENIEIYARTKKSSKLIPYEMFRRVKRNLSVTST